MRALVMLAYGAICLASGYLAGWYAHRNRKPVKPPLSRYEREILEIVERTK